MRKILLTLLTTLLCSITAWGAETVLFDSFDNTTASNYFKNYTVSSKTVTVATDQGISSSSEDYFVTLGSTPSNNNGYYIEVTVASATIKTVSVLITGNGSDKTCQPALLGWTGSIADNATADYVLVPSSRSISNKGLSNAQWHQFDVHGNDLTKVRIYRAVKGVDVAGESTNKTTFGNAQTFQLYGIRIELESSGIYSITYNCNGGTDCPETATNQANLPNPLPSPTKSGYALAGWYDNEELTGDPVTAGATLDDDITLYAKWVTAYTLTWNLNGGKVTTAGTGAAVDATGTPSIALAAGAAITTPEVARDYYDFDDWDSEPAATMPADNTTYTAQWTPLYATGTYTFENNASAGTAPNKLTMTEGTKVSVAAGSRVDNLFFSAQDIKYESGVYGGDGDDFKGWKINTNGATISFLVENDCDVTFGVGNLTSDATVSYTNQSGTPVNNSALTAKTDNTFSVKGGTVVTFKTSGGSTVTLKKIAITAACTSHSVTAATSTGTNTYGTVSAASATVCEGSTTTVTATPAAGYQVTNWAVTGTGASITPSGASSSTSTTLTMGTANATVTVTFGCVAPTSPSISGTTAYTEGQDISLTADASDKSASATYTWYKGATWDAASATTPVQAASTSGATFTKASSVEGDAGTYWCEISNGTGCDVQTSKTITVGPACTDPGLTITLN